MQKHKQGIRLVLIGCCLSLLVGCASVEKTTNNSYETIKKADNWIKEVLW